MADDTHTVRARPDHDAIERARHRDQLADEIERARRDWHQARTDVDQAARQLHVSIRAAVLAEQAYRAAVAAYEAAPR